MTRKRFYLKEFLPFNLVGVLLSGPQSLQRILLQELHTDTNTAAVGFFSGRGVQLGQLGWFLPEALNIKMTGSDLDDCESSDTFFCFLSNRELLQLSCNSDIKGLFNSILLYSISFYDHL